MLAVAIAALALGGRHGPTWTPASARYGFGADLTGWSYRVDRDAALPSLSFDLLWFARRDIATDGEVVIRLLDERGRVVGESSRQPLWGASPTSTWERGELVRDAQALPVPVGSGERDYRLALGWRTGSAEPEMREVGTVRIADDVAPTSSAVPEGFVALGGAAENGLTVDAYRVETTIGKSTDALSPGETVRLSILLRAGREVSSDAAVSAFFVGPAGEKIAVRDTYPPQLHDFTGAWLRGESRIVTLDLPTPDDLPDGFHHLAFELYDYRTGERIPVRLASASESQTRTEVATLRFVGLPRAPERAVRATFGDGIALAGYDLGGSDPAIRPKELLVALHWRASKVPTRDYKVFVHLYDESGKLVAQHDGSPSGGRLPTTDWRVDEGLLDRHALVLSDDLPSGDYRLVVGLYDPQTGQRLPVEGGADSVELGRIELH